VVPRSPRFPPRHTRARLLPPSGAVRAFFRRPPGSKLRAAPPGANDCSTRRGDVKELLETALAAAREAAGVHRAHLGRVAVEDWTEKGVADFVTHVDREAEAGILARIRERFPDHGVLAEEETSERHGV